MGRFLNRLRSDRGETLVELLVAIVILGVGFTGVIGGFVAAEVTTGLNASQASATAVLVSAAEAIKSNTTNPYSACYAPPGYSTAGVSVPSSLTVTIGTVEYWNGSGWTNYPSPCIPGVSVTPDNDRLQLIPVSVTNAHAIGPNVPATESVSIVKRNP